MVAILFRVRSAGKAVLICISMITKMLDLLKLLGHLHFLFWQLSTEFIYPCNDLMIWLLVYIFYSSLYTMNINTLYCVELIKIFFQSVSRLFTLRRVCFAVQKSLFHESHLSLFLTISCATGVFLRKSLPTLKAFF